MWVVSASFTISLYKDITSRRSQYDRNVRNWMQMDRIENPVDISTVRSYWYTYSQERERRRRIHSGIAFKKALKCRKHRNNEFQMEFSAKCESWLWKRDDSLIWSSLLKEEEEEISFRLKKREMKWLI